MPRNNMLAGGIAACLTMALLLAPAAALAKKGKDKPAPAMSGTTALIELPPGDDVLPDRLGAEAVDRNCLLCHSTETILNQPALSRDIWKAEIDKMRIDFNAQISPDADEAILAYLTSINGVRRDKWREADHGAAGNSGLRRSRNIRVAGSTGSPSASAQPCGWCAGINAPRTRPPGHGSRLANPIA